MARAIANVNSLTDTFEQWLITTNQLADAMSSNTVTVTSNTAGAAVTGNGYVIGALGANTVAVSIIKGGGAFVNVVPATGVANIELASSLHGGNSSVGVTITANTFGVKTGIGGTNATFGSVDLNITTSAIVTGNVTSNGFLLSNTCYTVDYSNTNLGATTGSPITLFTFNAVTTPTAKLTLQSKNGVNTEISEVLLASNAASSGTNSGANVFITVYGTVASPTSANVGAVTATQSGNTVTVSFTQSVSSSSVRVQATYFRY
jgi:hypothetical protein